MQTLAGIDTTQVYHEFGFDFDQFKDLKLKQYFVHNDAVNWFEEILANKFREFNFIKIIYERLYHFDINHVKCVEIYYGEHDLERFQYFQSLMDMLIRIARYRMPWISDTTYYVRSEMYLISDIENDLKAKDLHNCLIRRYEMKVDWCEKLTLTVNELKPNLNESQIKRLEKIFRFINDKFIFISEEFMFLKSTEPPLDMYSFVLNVYHGQFLSSLTLEDILSLELANKDHRVESYNSVLDCDIQRHLKNRFNLFYKHEKLPTYDASEFTDERVLKYFLYKYRDCFTTVELPHNILTENNYYLIRDEYRSLRFNDFQRSDIRYDIISPENITVCTVTLLRGHEDTIIESDYIITREVRSIEDINLGVVESEDENQDYFIYLIEISIRANCKSVRLTDLIHLILGHYNVNESSIIQLRSYNKRINSCILNSFVEREYEFQIIFKYIIFDFNRIVEWLSKCSRLVSISFIDCVFLLSNKSSRILKTLINQRKISDNCHLHLTFQNMNIDILTFSTLLHFSHGKIIYDRCCLMPSSSAIKPPTSLKDVMFQNMNIDLQLLVPLLPHLSFEFDNCQIQSNHDPILQVYSMAKSSRDNEARFRNMDIDAELLLQMSEYIRNMYLYHCRILSNEMVNLPSNYPTNSYAAIDLDNVEIELKAAAKVFNRFDKVIFCSSRFVCTELLTPKTPVKSNSILEFDNISITPEFIKDLKYLDLRNTISFNFCWITNQNLLEIWAAAPRCKRIYIPFGHQLDYNFYFELLAKLYENRVDVMLHELKDGVPIPLIGFFDIDWKESSFESKEMRNLKIRLKNIDWHNLKIRSVYVNDCTIKLELLENGKVLDFSYEQYKLLNDSDIYEVDYY